MSNAKNNDLLLGNIENNEQYPIDFNELEKAAKETLEAGPFGYIRSSAGGEETYRKNINSFSKYSIVPRFLNDVSTLNTEVTILGKTYPHPLFIAPVGVNKIAHEDGEIAVAKAQLIMSFLTYKVLCQVFLLKRLLPQLPEALNGSSYTGHLTKR